MSAYLRWVEGWADWHDRAAELPVGPAVPPAPLAEPPASGPVALLFSPHPDDECLTGALPLRLRREGWRVINVAVTLGSRPERRAARLAELERACDLLGFGLVLPEPGGLERVRVITRRENPAHWTWAVNAVGRVLLEYRPQVVFTPHSGDAHPAHQGTQALVRHALLRAGRALACHLVETEYWAPMERPGLLVESTAGDVAQLLQALCCHAGELARNPYHARFPAWLMDNVRRGGELLAGAGGIPPPWRFGTLYGLKTWRGRRVRTAAGTALLGAGAGASALFPALEPEAPDAPPAWDDEDAEETVG